MERTDGWPAGRRFPRGNNGVLCNEMKRKRQQLAIIGIDLDKRGLSLHNTP